MQTPRTLNGKQKIALIDWLRENAHDGKINLKIGSLTKAAEIFLGCDISPSTITSHCDYLDIEYAAISLKGGERNRSKAMVELENRVAELDNRVAALGEQVQYLMRELCTKKERESVLHPFPNAEGRS